MGDSNMPPKGYVGGSILPQPSNRVKMKVYMGGGLPEHKIQKGGYKKDGLKFRGVPYSDIKFDKESYLYKIIFHIVKAKDKASMTIVKDVGELIIPVMVKDKKILALENSEIKIKHLFLFDEIDIDILQREGQYFTIGTLSFDTEETFVIPTTLDELSKIPVISGTASAEEMPEDEITEEQEKPNIHKLAYGFSVRWIEQAGLDKKCVTRKQLTEKPIPESFTPGERAVFDYLGFDTKLIKDYINKDSTNKEEFLDFWTLYLNRDGTNNFVLMYSRPMRDYIQKIRDVHTKFLKDDVLKFLRKAGNPSRIDTTAQPFDEKDYYFFEKKSTGEAEKQKLTEETKEEVKEETKTVPEESAQKLGDESKRILEILQSIDTKEKILYGIAVLLKDKIGLYANLKKDNKTIISHEENKKKMSDKALELKKKAYLLYIKVSEEEEGKENKKKIKDLNIKIDELNTLLSDKAYYNHYSESDEEFILDRDFQAEKEKKEEDEDEDEEEDLEEEDLGELYIKLTGESEKHKQQILDIPYIKVSNEVVLKIQERHKEYFELFKNILKIVSLEKPKEDTSGKYSNADNNITYINGLVNIYNLFLQFNKDTIQDDIYKQMCKVYNPTDITFLNGDEETNKILEGFRKTFCKKKTRSQESQKGGFRKTRSLRKRRVSPRRKRT